MKYTLLVLSMIVTASCTKNVYVQLDPAPEKTKDSTYITHAQINNDSFNFMGTPTVVYKEFSGTYNTIYVTPTGTPGNTITLITKCHAGDAFTVSATDTTYVFPISGDPVAQYGTLKTIRITLSAQNFIVVEYSDMKP